MIEGFKIPEVTFRIREGDTSDNEILCAIGGKWTNKSTDDFFKNKRVILLVCPELLHQRVPLNNYLGLNKMRMN